MKIKYLVYGILIVSFGGFISYRIIENKGTLKQTITNQENQR
jgi:hypothetical protein